ncbi:MAG: Wzz/FepE/Etk N-terminal domain-containing protein [Candidatus Acetothermia bacterium]
MEREPYAPYEYEVDLRDYIRVMWENKWLILAIIIIAIGAAFGFSQLQSPGYSASSSVLVTTNISGNLVEELKDGGFSSQILYPGIYRQTAKSEETLQAVIDQLGLKDSSGSQLSPDSLKSQVSVSVDYDAANADQDQSEEEPVTQFERIPAVTFTVKGDSPKDLGEIAAEWTDVFSERIKKLFSTEIDRYYNGVRKSFQELQEELAALEEKKLTYQKDQRVEMLSTEVESLEGQYLQVTTRLQEQEISLRGLEAKSSSLSESLNSEPQFLQLERGITDEMLMILLDDTTAPDGDSGEGERLEELKKGLGLKFADQVKNDVYFETKRELVGVEGEIASTKESIQSLKERKKELLVEIEQSENKLLDANLEIKGIDREVSSLIAEYRSLRKTYRNLERLMGDGVIDVQVLDSPSGAKLVSPVNTRQNVAVAGVLGIFLGVLIAFFKHYMEGYNWGEDSEDETA